MSFKTVERLAHAYQQSRLGGLIVVDEGNNGYRSLSLGSLEITLLNGVHKPDFSDPQMLEQIASQLPKGTTGIIVDENSLRLKDNQGDEYTYAVTIGCYAYEKT